MAKFSFFILNFLILLSWGCQFQATQPQTVNIAAASDTVYLFQSLKANFEIEHPEIKLQITHAASGILVSQIEQGAPFDLFFSADDLYPQHLIKNGHALKESLYHYGTGELVIWLPCNSPVNTPDFTLLNLKDQSIKKISLANPAHAPFGKLAKRVLEHAQLYELLEPKLVLAENISQAFQYVQLGNVEVGLISLSLTKHPTIEPGVIITIPAEYSPTIEQHAVELRHASHPQAVKLFMEFIKSEAAQQIFIQHGFKK